MDRSQEHYLDKLRQYYNEKAAVYKASYTGDGRYKSNYFRLLTVLRLLGQIQPQPRLLLEAGCGDARVVAAAIHAGYECLGFDFSPQMLAEGENLLRGEGIDPSILKQGNLFDIPYEPQTFDAVLCLGVLPNLPDHQHIFAQFRRVLKPGGRLIISLNNELFSLFSINAYTLQFYEYLFKSIGVPEGVRKDVLQSMRDCFNLMSGQDVPMVMHQGEVDRSHASLEIYTPLNMADVLRTRGFALEEIRYYHYRPFPPCFEPKYPKYFQEFAESLETTEYDWRGGILCNAMIVQARLA